MEGQVNWLYEGTSYSRNWRHKLFKGLEAHVIQEIGGTARNQQWLSVEVQRVDWG